MIAACTNWGDVAGASAAVAIFALFILFMLVATR